MIVQKQYYYYKDHENYNVNLLNNLYDLVLFGSFTFLTGIFLTEMTLLTKIIKKHFFPKKVVIVRGVPGVGKRNYVYSEEKDKNRIYSVCDMNEFFTTDDEFKFEGKYITKAENFSYNKFLNSMYDGLNIIYVIGYFNEKWTYQNYITAAKLNNYEVELVELECKNKAQLRYFNKRSTHDVPMAKSNKLWDNWEEDNEFLIVDPYLEKNWNNKNDCLIVTDSDSSELDSENDEENDEENDLNLKDNFINDYITNSEKNTEYEKNYEITQVLINNGPNKKYKRIQKMYDNNFNTLFHSDYFKINENENYDFLEEKDEEDIDIEHDFLEEKDEEEEEYKIEKIKRTGMGSTDLFSGKHTKFEDDDEDEDEKVEDEKVEDEDEEYEKVEVEETNQESTKENKSWFNFGFGFGF